MKTIFISRDLTSTSVFKKELEAAGFVIHGKSLLNFSPIPFRSVPRADWIFFYSKNGVKFFFKGLKDAGKPIPKKAKWGTIGKGTAKALSTKVPQVNFIGSGNTINTAAEFLKLAKGQTILFVQAENSRQTVQRMLEDSITAKDLIVYKNVIKPQVSIPDCDGLVFTSPMNATAYFTKKKQILLEHQNVFAIGRTTAKTLVSFGIEDFHVVEEPSEEAMAKEILKMKS